MLLHWLDCCSGSLVPRPHPPKECYCQGVWPGDEAAAVADLSEQVAEIM